MIELCDFHQAEFTVDHSVLQVTVAMDRAHGGFRKGNSGISRADKRRQVSPER